MRLDEEVFAVVLAISVVASAVGIALSIPRQSEPFVAIGLLNERGFIGDYPAQVAVGQQVNLRVFVYNHLGYAALFKVDVKVGYGAVPTNQTPLPTPPLRSLFVALGNDMNATLPVSVELDRPFVNQTLVFELYRYAPDTGAWEYTGQFVFLRLNVTGWPP